MFCKVELIYLMIKLQRNRVLNGFRTVLGQILVSREGISAIGVPQTCSEKAKDPGNEEISSSTYSYIYFFYSAPKIKKVTTR